MSSVEPLFYLEHRTVLIFGIALLVLIYSTDFVYIFHILFFEAHMLVQLTHIANILIKS